MLDDTLAIGGFATAASVLKEPISSEINTELVTCVKRRLEFGVTRLDDPKMTQILNDEKEIQKRILILIKKAIVENNTPTAHVSLLNGYGEMTEAYDKRYYIIQNQVPSSIVFMLILFAVNAAFMMGRFTPAGSKLSSLAIRMGIYILLVVLVFDITIDLEQPRKGIMRVSQAPMQDLLTFLSVQ